MSKRETGLDSWLDKLFSNLPEFERRQQNIQKQCKISKEFDVQFEISTNVSYDNKSLKSYAQNDSYQFPKGSNLKEDNLAINLRKPFMKSVKVSNKIVSTQELLFTDLVGHEPEWCLGIRSQKETRRIKRQALDEQEIHFISAALSQSQIYKKIEQLTIYDKYQLRNVSGMVTWSKQNEFRLDNVAPIKECIEDEMIDPKNCIPKMLGNTKPYLKL
ncbi:hypothetical protein D3C73_917970 [compost metagenome]